MWTISMILLLVVRDYTSESWYNGSITGTKLVLSGTTDTGSIESDLDRHLCSYSSVGSTACVFDLFLYLIDAPQRVHHDATVNGAQFCPENPEIGLEKFCRMTLCEIPIIVFRQSSIRCCKRRNLNIVRAATRCTVQLLKTISTTLIATSRATQKSRNKFADGGISRRGGVALRL